MRRFNLLIILALLSNLMFSQNLKSDFSKQMDEGGDYLQRANVDTYLSMGCGVLSAACFVWAADSMKKDPTQTPVLERSLGYGFAAAGVIFFIAHSVHIGKAGDKLRNASKIHDETQPPKLTFNTCSDGIGIAVKF